MGTFQMDTDEFRSTGTTVTGESGNFQEEVSRFLSAADAMNGAWEGVDKDAFDNIVAELKPLLEKAQQNLNSVGSNMSNTGDAGDTNASDNASMIGSSLG